MPLVFSLFQPEIESAGHADFLFVGQNLGFKPSFDVQLLQHIVNQPGMLLECVLLGPAIVHFPLNGKFQIVEVKDAADFPAPLCRRNGNG